MATIKIDGSHVIVNHFTDNILPNVAKKKITKITPRSNIVKKYTKALSKRNVTAKPKAIFEEMKALLKMAEAVYYDKKSESLTLMTEEIVATRQYRGKSYGNFFIVIPLTKEINSIPVFNDYVYGIRIFAPHRQRISREYNMYVHHVNLISGSVCLGDGNVAIKRLKQGYISEFFEIVRQFIKYNGC